LKIMADGDDTKENQAAPSDQRLRELLQRKKYAFYWSCIFMGLAAIALGGFYFVVYWEKRQLAELLSGPRPTGNGTGYCALQKLRVLEGCLLVSLALLQPWLRVFDGKLAPRDEETAQGMRARRFHRAE